MVRSGEAAGSSSASDSGSAPAVSNPDLRHTRDQNKTLQGVQPLPLFSRYYVDPSQALPFADITITKVAPVLCTERHQLMVSSYWCPAGLEVVLQRKHLPLRRWQASEPGPTHEGDTSSACQKMQPLGSTWSRQCTHWGSQQSMCLVFALIRSFSSLLAPKQPAVAMLAVLLCHSEMMLGPHRIWPSGIHP